MVSAYGNKDGEITVRAPRLPGQYEARLFVYGTKYNEQAISRFTIADNDRVSIVESSPASADASSALSISAGSPVSVLFAARTVESTSSDWVGMYPVEQTNNKSYLDTKYTSGQTSGTLNFTAPSLFCLFPLL